MEAAIIKLLTGNPDPWQIFFGIVILLLVVTPRLIALRDALVGYRENRGQVERQKQTLELLKLQYEIAALRKTHDLQEITLVDSTLVSREEKKIEDIQPSPFWLLLVKHPVLGGILIRLLQGIVGFYVLAFGLGSLAMPFVFLFEDGLELSPGDEMVPIFMVIGWLFYVVITYFLYRFYGKIKRWADDLRSDARPREILEED